MTKKSTYFKTSSPIKTILLEDIYKCSNRFQAETLLEDSYTIETMLEHLSERYGEIDESFFVNYDIEAIMNRVGMGARPNDGEVLALKSPIETELEASLAQIGKKRNAASASDTDNVLESDNFESLMLSMDSKSLTGQLSDTHTEFDDDEYSVERAFTKEELFD